ncbi:MAG: protein-glutamate O-methyltransferase CheR [Deltaproteobacteria bacterium]|nr:protein-glutamate O-methyltransferase CheR [Deltaproteobacteria bacterium]
MATRDASLSPSLFRRLADIARAQAGIHLREGKEALLSARIAKRMRVLGLVNARSYLRYLEADTSGVELLHFVDVVTTNYTSFFREPTHFDALRAFVNAAAGAGQRRFTLWCAAAASGEEPFSMAMVMADAALRLGIEFKILATDISTCTLAKARAGVYSRQALGPLSPGERRRFFRRRGVGDDGTFVVCPEIRDHVAFDRVNLAAPPLPMRGPFDAIFCRNVMIYLDRKVRTAVVAEVERLLRPGGLFAIGHAETLTGIPTTLKANGPSLYRK